MNSTCRRNDKLFMFPHDHRQLASIPECAGYGRSQVDEFVFCDSEYGETTANCMLRRFETLLMAHTFVETTVDFTLGDVLDTAISVAIYAKSYMREKAGIQHLVDRLPSHAMLYRGDAGEFSSADRFISPVSGP